jgi:uncharacterized protein YgiM (DUF1202 family)
MVTPLSLSSANDRQQTIENMKKVIQRIPPSKQLKIFKNLSPHVQKEIIPYLDSTVQEDAKSSIDMKHEIISDEIICDDIEFRKLYVHSNVNVRGGPGTNFEITKKLSKNEGVDVGKSENGWACIYSSSQDSIGYVYAKLLKTTPLAIRTKKDSYKKSPPTYIDPYTADDPFLAGAINELRKIDAELGF